MSSSIIMPMVHSKVKYHRMARITISESILRGEIQGQIDLNISILLENLPEVA